MHNPGGTARSKHIDVAHHSVWDRVDRGDLVVRYVRTEEMVADVLAKALPGASLDLCRIGLGVEEVAEVDEKAAYGDGCQAESVRGDDPSGGHPTWPDRSPSRRALLTQD